MTAAGLLSLALVALQTVLDAAIKNKAADTIIADIEAAIAKLVSVQGSPVTFAQLEGLRVSKEW